MLSVVVGGTFLSSDNFTNAENDIKRYVILLSALVTILLISFYKKPLYFRNETILYYQTGKFYFFDLKMDIYKKNSQTPHSKNIIYGTYDAGISNIYTTSSNFQIGFTI